MDCLLGIDIGTTDAKSALFTAEGGLIDSEYIPYPLIYPREGWVEQDPDEWWNALTGTVRPLVSRNRAASAVRALSLSTQGGCLLLLDEYFRPLGNAISWLDHRARETAPLLEESISTEDVYRTCGWSTMSGLNFPTAFWFRHRQPDLFTRARYFASTVDYLNYRLTGRFAIDYSSLALTEFLDIARKDWSDSALAIAGIPRDRVAEIVPSGKVIGKLQRDIADELGLPGSALLVSGAHDQYCSNVGAGAVDTGDCVLSAGTAWVLTVTADRPVFDEEHIIHPCIHVIEGKYGLMTSVPSGGNSLNWFLSTFYPEAGFDELGRAAEDAPAGCDGLLFIPQNMSRTGKGSFLGIDTVHGRGHFVRSIMEGVALSNRRHLETLRKNGVPVNRIIMIGGGAKSVVWPQIVADAANIPLTVNEQTEAACTGAAMLAGVGCGLFPTIRDSCARFLSLHYQILPDERSAAVYDRMYGDFVKYCEAN